MEKIEMDAIQILVAVMLLTSAILFVTYGVASLTPLGPTIQKLAKRNSNVGNNFASFGEGMIEGFIPINTEGD